MTPAARIQTTLDLLVEIHTRHLPADGVLHHFFRKHRFIGSKDRQVLQSWVFDFYRYLPSTFWVTQYFNPKFSIPHDLRAFLLVFLQRRHFFSSDDLDRLCNGATHHPQPLSPDERILIHKVSAYDNTEMPAWVTAEIPEHWRGLFESSFKDTWPMVASSLNHQASTDLRINTLKLSIDQGRLQAQIEFPDIKPTPYAPAGLRLASRKPLSACPLYVSGNLEIQDEGSQLVSHLVNPQPGMEILDYCAGAGGKTLALASLMHNRGQIFAFDPVPSRIKRTQERLRRAGAFNVQCKILDAFTQRWLDHHKERFDRILLDVPCSGSGTWRRNPDLKWRMKPQDLSELLEKQAAILSIVVPYLKEGGILIYATCSLFSCENQDQIAKFMDHHPYFHLLNAESILKDQGISYTSPSPFLTLLPHIHGTDGFFAAALIKRSTVSSIPHPS